jgi:hypothetical protein
MLANGQSVITDVQENFYLTDLPAIFFPNPVIGRTESLNVITSQLISSGLLVLRDTQGREVLRQTIFTDVESVDVSAIDPGLYLISFEFNGQRYSQRLVIK